MKKGASSALVFFNALAGYRGNPASGSPLTALRRCVLGGHGRCRCGSHQATRRSGGVGSRSTSPVDSARGTSSQSGTLHVRSPCQLLALCIGRQATTSSAGHGNNASGCTDLDIGNNFRLLFCNRTAVVFSSSCSDTSQAVRLESLRNQALGRAGCNDHFRHFGTGRVVLVSRQSHSSQDTDDRHNDHQFNQGETLLHGTHGAVHNTSPQKQLQRKPRRDFPRLHGE